MLCLCLLTQITRESVFKPNSALDELFENALERLDHLNSGILAITLILRRVIECFNVAKTDWINQA